MGDSDGYRSRHVFGDELTRLAEGVWRGETEEKKVGAGRDYRPRRGFS